MNPSTWLRTMGVVVVAAIALTACGGGGGGGGGAASTNPEISTDGENLAFAPATITIPAGKDVSITFKNGSASQQHNFVVVKGGDDVAAQVAQAGVTAGPPNYIPQGDANVAAAGNILNGGASEAVKVNLPAGTYTYICTFPGHYPSMKGSLTVQ